MLHGCGPRKMKNESDSLKKFNGVVNEMALNHVHSLNPDISIYILLTFLCAFPVTMARRICLIIKASQVDDHFSQFS